MTAIIDTKLVAIANRRSEASAGLNKIGDLVLVERGRPRILLMKCPCGCGEELPVNLDAQAGKAWRIYNWQGKITLYPSVWRDTGCQSHFIIWNGRTYLFGMRDDDLFDWPDSEGGLEEEVVARLSDSLVHYLDIADGLEAIPWNVLFACRSLTRKGAAIEGRDKQRGYFRLAPR